MAAYALHRKVRYGAAFDVLGLKREIDLTDADEIARNIDAINICEVKSTNCEKLGGDFKGHFFNITAGELLTAQSVGERYRFVFWNAVTSEYQQRALAEVFAAGSNRLTAFDRRECVAKMPFRSRRELLRDTE